jgi:hypothetical protein
MNKYSILFLIATFFLVSCENNNTKNDITYDPKTSELSSKQEDSTPLKFTHDTLNSVIADRDTQSFVNGSNLKTDDYIKQYPTDQKAGLRQHIEQLRKDWKNVPNPIIATYQGNDFGDYHHIIFKDANGVGYDFGQAKNDYGQYNLHELSGQYNDNPKFLGKKFRVFWDWKLSEFLCCEGDYGKAKAYLPSITKLELIKK